MSKVFADTNSGLVHGDLLQVGNDPTVWRVAAKCGAAGGVVAFQLEPFLQAAWKQGADD